LEAIALAPFCGICLAWRGKAKMSIYERGVALEYFSCPVSHGPPEICILLSHYCGEGACEEIDPGCEIVYSKHMTQGDPFCLGICKRKDEPGAEPDQLGKLLRVVDDLEVDEKERDALSINFETWGLKIFLESFLQGDHQKSAHRLLVPIFESVGKEAGRRILKEGPESLERSISTLLTWGEMLGQNFDISGDKKDGYKLMVKGCLYYDSAPNICDLMETFLAGMISTSSPQATIRFEKCKKDCDCCEIVLRSQPMTSDMENDPLKALKMRFVKDEISEEEYLRKRAILLEK